MNSACTTVHPSFSARRPPPATVLLVEPSSRADSDVAASIRRQPGLELVAVCTTVERALVRLDATRPRVLLADLDLDDGRGLTLIEHARNNGHTVAMVISAVADEATVVRAFEAGAEGYLLKDERKQKIGRSICEALAGGAPVSPAVARILLRRLRASGASTVATEPPPELTSRESEILRYMSQGFKIAEIGELAGLSPHTVSNHFRKIYRKLEVSSRTAAVYEAVQLGLITLRE